MIGDFFSWLFAAFVVDPMQAEVIARLEGAKAPIAVVSQVNACVQTTATTLIERAGNDLWWAVSTTISVTIGDTSVAELLDATNPACGSIATYLTASANS